MLTIQFIAFICVLINMYFTVPHEDCLHELQYEGDGLCEVCMHFYRMKLVIQFVILSVALHLAYGVLLA